MARPLRVEFPGAIYHAMSRGNARQKIFRGRDSFVDWVKRKFLLARAADPREEPALVHLQRSHSVPDLAAIVAREYAVEAKQLLVRRSRHGQARAVLMYLADVSGQPTLPAHVHAH